MSELSLSQDIISLRGEVSFKTVTGLSQQLQELVQPQVRTLDCSGVTKADSSIVALLLVAMKLARSAGASVTITGAPQAVSRLVHLYDVDGIIPGLVNTGHD